MDTCQLCGKHEDERNTQEQMGYTICLGCDGFTLMKSYKIKWSNHHEY
jgi:hypothetical protein